MDNENFRKGDVVRMTERAIKGNLGRSKGSQEITTGVVTADSRGEFVQVLRDGLKTSQKYSTVFWELSNPRAA